MRKIRNKKTLSAVYISVIIAVSLAVWLFQYFSDTSRFGEGSYSEADVVLHMIDVGQGDAVFIDNGDKDILIDSGTGESAPILLDYLDRLGVSEIEYAFFSHPHEDHIGGGDDVITHFEVENVVMPNYSEDTECYRDLMKVIKNRGCNLTYAYSGDSFRSGDVKVDILSPGKGYKSDEANLVSLIMRVSYGEIDIMFTGDAEATNENYVLGRYPEMLDCEILKAGHHGSSTSSTEDFVEAVSPEVVLISVGEGNSYGHPHRETLAVFNSHADEVHRTDREGDLVIGISKEKFWFIEK